jgi:hypothetical protein
MQRLGTNPVQIPRVRAAIGATAWNPKSGAQSVDHTAGNVPLQQAAAVADLAQLFNSRGPAMSVYLAPEDLSTQRHGQIFTREALAAGLDITGASVDECMKLIDQRPTLQSAYQQFLNGNVGFYQNFSPADPELDRLYPGRARNIQFLGRLATAHDAGEISALQTLYVARDYA